MFLSLSTIKSLNWMNFCSFRIFVHCRIFSSIPGSTHKIAVKVWVTQSCLTLCNPWTRACQALLSMEFSRQEYWSGFPFPLQGIFPTQRLNFSLTHYRQILYPLCHQGSPIRTIKKFPSVIKSLLGEDGMQGSPLLRTIDVNSVNI